MAELIIVIGKTKKDVIDAIKLKSKVEELGIRVVKVVAIDSEGESIPHELIENMLNVKVLTKIELEDFKSEEYL